MPRGRFRRESKGKLSLKHIKFHGNGRLSFKIIICDHGLAFVVTGLPSTGANADHIRLPMGWRP
jgi:hypothetical protein